MPSLIYRNYSRLRRRHYIRNATAENHWFDFTASRLDGYVHLFGEEFCLIVNGSLERDDAYVFPYAMAKRWFHKEDLDARGRWIGTIIADRLKLTRAELSIPVGQYRNAFDQLRLGLEASKGGGPLSRFDARSPDGSNRAEN